MDHTVHTEVSRDRGQWQVHLVLIEPEGISRRLLSTHRSEEQARLAASLVQRAAHRRRRPPPEP